MIPAEAIEQTSGLVQHFAKRFSRAGRGVELEDLLQVGREAALAAATRWTPEHGASFSTYAYRSIHGAMLQYVHLSVRRGMTPGYRFGAPRKIASLDRVLVADGGEDEGTTLHDFLGATPDLEMVVDLVHGAKEPTTGRQVHERTYEGRTMSLHRWAGEVGVPYPVLYARTVVKGWTFERAISTPVAKQQGGRGRKAA